MFQLRRVVAVLQQQCFIACLRLGDSDIRAFSSSVGGRSGTIAIAETEPKYLLDQFLAWPISLNPEKHLVFSPLRKKAFTASI